MKRSIPALLPLILVACNETTMQTSAPPLDKARIYAMVGFERGGAAKYRNQTTGDVAINGTRAGSITTDQCLLLDLRPGTYTITITDLRTGRAGTQTYTLDAGQSKVLGLDLQRNFAGLAGAPLGVIGVAAVQSANPSRAVITDRTAEGLVSCSITTLDASALGIRPQ